MTKETKTTDKASVKARFIIGSNTEEGKYHGKAFRKNEQGQLVADDCGMDLNCVFVCKETQSTLKDLAERLKGADARYVAFYSVLRTALSGQFYIAPKSRVDDIKKKYHTENVIARTNDYLMYAQGVPGILAIDMDDIPEREVRKRIDEMLDLFPFLKEYDRIEFYSSSSNIYDEQGNLVKPPKGVRILFVIDDASKIPQVAQIIYDRLALAGKGFIKIASDGFMLERSYIDLAIYKVTQPDYICKSEVPFGYEHRKEVTFFEGSKSGQAVPASKFKKLTAEDKADVKSNFAIAKRISQAEADKAKAEWLSTRTDAEREMYARFEATQTLSLDWTVYDAKGNPVSVRHMRNNAGEYMGTWFYDPIAGKMDAATGEAHNRSATLRKDNKTGQFYIQSFKGSRKYLIESDKKQAVVDGDWRNRLMKTKAGDIDNTSIVNAAIITKVLAEEKGGKLRWNEFTDAPEVDGAELSDAVCGKMRHDAELLVDYYRLSKENFSAGVSVSAQKDKYHPVKEWFESLPEWDGIERVDTLLIRHGGVEDTQINRKMMRMWMISCVAAVHIVPAKIDTALYIWEPLGGTGKSTFFETLCPNKKYYLVLNKDISNDKIYEQFRGKWLIEMPEMAALRKSDAERTKTFITTRTDKYRIPYEQFASDHHRQCVLNVTANGPDLANDKALQRRFFPMEINAVDGRKGTKIQIDNPAILKEREQVWAEALYRFNQGEKWHVPDNDPLFDELEKAQSSAVKQNTFAETLAEKLDNDPIWEHRDKISLTQCCEILGFKNASKNLKSEIKSEMMNVQGWRYTTPQGQNVWIREKVSFKSLSEDRKAFFEVSEHRLN